jgi:hypothetical protein
LDLTRPAALKAVQGYLGRLAQHRDLHLGDLHLWCPDKAELKGFRFCRNHRSPAWILDKFMASMERAGCFPLAEQTESNSQRPKRPADYAEALKKMRKAASWDSYERRERARRQVQEQRARQISDPLMKDALAEPCPWERNRRVMAAGLSDLVHRELERIDEELSRDMNANRDLSEVISGPRLKALLANVKAISTLSPKVLPCPATTTASIVNAPRIAVTGPRVLPSSG